jgi:hypothetical protein
MCSVRRDAWRHSFLRTEHTFEYALEGGKMKIKKFNKKLGLNKKTIVNLEDRELKNVNGGGDRPPKSIIYDVTACPSLCHTFCPPC